MASKLMERLVELYLETGLHKGRGYVSVDQLANVKRLRGVAIDLSNSRHESYDSIMERGKVLAREREALKNHEVEKARRTRA